MGFGRAPSMEVGMSNLYAGLDVSDQNTAICVMNSAGHIVHEGSTATDPAAIALALKPFRKLLDSVAQESGTKAAWLHKELSRRRLPMVCLDARHAQAALAAKPNKTDKNDARGLAMLLARGLFTTAHMKSAESQRLRLLLAARKPSNARRSTSKAFFE
jgi:transposase